MWSFKKGEKVWTCPQNSLMAIAHIQASDRDDAIKDGILNNEIAKTYLEKLGFEVMEIPEPEELTEVPKIPNWYDRRHRALYDKLFYHDIGRELTKEEDDFCRRMYHFEEFACGLDG